MCTVSRRAFLTAGAAALLSAEFEEEAMAGVRGPVDVGVVEKMSEGVYFHEGDLSGKGHCNNGWVVFDDYVLVIDANFPSGANEIIPKIRAITEKPIRFAFDTHHHGDHAYGNQVWVDNGAAVVAHTGVVEEMKKYEPGRWNDTARGREDVRNSKLKHPSVLFPREMIFDDGKRRVELIHLGTAHTNGDAFAWLPKERILFTGDACVNGPYNYCGDGDVRKWIDTLAAARKLGAKAIGPGHGPRGTDSVLDDQRAYFLALRDEVGRGIRTKGLKPDALVDQVLRNLTANPRIARYASKNGIGAQVDKVHRELTGKPLRATRSAVEHARRQHAHNHGTVLA